MHSEAFSSHNWACTSLYKAQKFIEIFYEPFLPTLERVRACTKSENFWRYIMKHFSWCVVCTSLYKFITILNITLEAFLSQIWACTKLYRPGTSLEMHSEAFSSHNWACTSLYNVQKVHRDFLWTIITNTWTCTSLYRVRELLEIYYEEFSVGVAVVQACTSL